MREWKEKLQRFMIGRYGTDQLARFLSGCILVLLILNLFIRDRILYWLALALLSYCYFRMFSKNISARLRENAVYLRWRSQVTEKLKKWKAQAVQAWKYHIYRCPGCGQKIRIPRGRGKVSIHCPKCHTDFIRRS
ncbi:MAG: hypothetical protein HFG22_05345 [Lachnospiraceae bacterium]|nr:hypothetical protein [Lachnospiraceae bacterium]